MKRFLSFLVAGAILGFSHAGWAACTNWQLKDNASSLFTMGLQSDGTNCAGEAELVQGGALVAATNGLFIQPGTGAIFAASQNGSWTVGLSAGSNTIGAVTQASGPWSISATSLPLPTGAASAANQTSVQGAVGAGTAPADMAVGGGIYNSTLPTLTTGQSAALQLDASGRLLVDGSGATQPVSGTLAATQSGTWTVQPGNTANTTAWLVTGAGGTFPATQSGTWTVQPGNTANTTAWLFNLGDVNGSAAAALSDALANPTTFALGSYSLGWDATNSVWRRLQVDAGTGVQKVDNSAQTQPVSAAALPLPAGAATAANQTGVQSAVGSSASTAVTVQGSASGVALPVSAASLPLPSGAATQATLASILSALNAPMQNSGGSVTANQGGAPWTVNPGTAANWGVGATGSAAPANGVLASAVSSGNLTGIIQADNSAAINVSTATTTQLVALSAGKKIYVTNLNVTAGGTGNITFEYGTGTTCGTGTTALTGVYNLTAQNGLAMGGGLGPVLVVPAGDALCVLTSAAVQMSGSIAFTQF